MSKDEEMAAEFRQLVRRDALIADELVTMAVENGEATLTGTAHLGGGAIRIEKDLHIDRTS